MADIMTKDFLKM